MQITKFLNTCLAEITKLFTNNDLSKFSDAEDDFIAQNDKTAQDNLIKYGWKIIGIDTRVFHYSYKIKKDNTIQEVSIREALKF